MGCKELQITDYFRLTPTTESEAKHTGFFAGTRKTANSRFEPVVSVSIPNHRYDSSKICPVVRCHPDMQQYWLNRVIMNLSYYSPNVFCIFETKKQKYKIKLIAPSYELHQLFKEFEEDVSEEPPPPTPEEE